MDNKELEEYFILEEECDSKTMRTAIINSDEMFAIDEVTIAIKGNYIYSVLHEKNSCMEYEDNSEAKTIFDILKTRLKEA